MKTSLRAGKEKPLFGFGVFRVFGSMQNAKYVRIRISI